jgi:NADH-quinone oxidoreductase subunit N
LALAFAVLLLGQAGIPFTTGFLAKFGVVGAVVATHGYALAAIAMVSAAVAAFFYLRVAVTMYSPVGAVADPVDGDAGAPASTGDPRPATGTDAVTGTGLDADADSVTVDGLASLSVLTDDEPAEAVRQRGAVPVPLLTTVSISLCVGFTVVFGIIPEPILDFAHQATLLFT